MSQAPSPQVHMPQRMHEHQDSAQLMQLQSARDQWLHIAEAGGLEQVPAATLQRELASLLDMLASAAATGCERELSLLSSLVCSVVRTVFGVDGQLVADPHVDQLSATMSRLSFEVAQAAIEVPVTAVPIVAASVDQLLAGGGSDAAGSCTVALTNLAVSCLGLVTATFSSLAWYEKAGTKAFAEVNTRLRTVVKDVMVPALAACMQTAMADSTKGAAALCEACCARLFQMGHIVSLIIDGRHPLAGRKEFRSFNTLNAAWAGLVKLLLAVPQDCRPAVMQLKGFSVAESIAVVMTAVDTAMRQLLQGLTPALLQVVRFWMQHLVKLSPAYPGLVAVHWHTIATLLGLLLDHRHVIADHPLAANIEEHVLPRVAGVTIAVLGSAAELRSPAASEDGSNMQDHSDASGAVDSDTAADSASQELWAAALVDQLCTDVPVAAIEPHARHRLRALLHLLGHAQALPAAVLQRLATRGLPAALAAAGQLGCGGSGGDGGWELRQEAAQSVLCFLAVCCKDGGIGGADAAAWAACQQALLMVAVTADHPGHLQLLAHVLCTLFRRASAELCDSFLEALAALLRAAALAAAQGALPLLRHLPELLGVLVAAAPDASQAAWRSKLSRDAAARIASERGRPAALAQLTAVRHSMCSGSAADLHQQAAAPLAAAVAAVEEALALPSVATDLPCLLGCLETAASITLSAAGAEADTDCQGQLRRLPQLAGAALLSSAAQSDPAALLPAVRLCAVAAQATGQMPTTVLPAMTSAMRHPQAQQAVAAALRHCGGAGPADAQHVTQIFHAALQEPAWLVRHAVMESLVEVLRGTPDLDPRALVPPCLLAADGAAGWAGCGAQAFATQLQLYMHRSPPPPQQSDGSCSGNICGAAAAAMPAASMAAQLTDQHAAVVAQLEALRAPQAVPQPTAGAEQTDKPAKQQEVQAALADCWQCLEEATAACMSTSGPASRHAQDEVARAAAAVAALQAVLV